MTPSASPPRPLDLTRLAAGHLAEKGIEEARLDAELLLAHVLGIRRLDLYLQFERPLEPDEVDAYREAVRRRAAREPLQYITGEAAFRELTLAVDPRVLIPRPETEVLVEEVLEFGRGVGEGEGEATASRATILDIGTGSGAIVLSLLHEGPFERAVATDASEGALEVAAANAGRAGLADRVELRHGSLWEPIGDGEEFRVIVSNPPYVADADRSTLEPEVGDHEPDAALFAGEDGLEVIRSIVAGAPAHLSRGGLLAVEVGLGQAGEVAALFRAAGFAAPRIAADLAGRERIVSAVHD
ncbi:MAG: peptide chain release factor N(5)-glutamine methyltransferase [Candidatus Longimicrobiales bacterium M2_2A_002]